ncbi:HYR domain-containing protein [Oceanobacillus senegalensis]|uniref:HYR domain-containing protein n=1 Tax=Oceanobacillus senegalensis TaxID=1936063 RepID=UPI000A311A35|nr:HYR domain-containing protein [Oceanobacillus senegalensis]
MPSEVFIPDDFPTIQAGINAVDSGGTVHVAAGLYTPSSTILITKPVTILGPQANVDPRPNCFTTRTPGDTTTEAIIDGNNTLSTIIRIQADDVTLNGFEIRNGTGDLVDSLAAAPVKQRPKVIYNIIHAANRDEGIQLRNIVEGVISYNHVFDTAGDGINMCCGTTDSVISFNEVHDIRSPDAAIYVYESTFMRIEGNIVYNVSINDGIKLGDAGGVDANLSGGLILNNLVHDIIEDGITVKTSDTVVEGNEIYNSTSRNGAIFLDYDIDNIDIINNCIHDNGVLGDGKTTYGIRGGIDNKLPTNVHVNFNNIFDNIDGGLFYNSLTGTPLNAENNWWGSPDGPNTPGGDTVVGNVDYDPWLSSAAPVCNPRITCPENITVENDTGECSAVVSYTISASSNDCGITEITGNGQTETYSPPQPSVTLSEQQTFPVGSTLVTYTATNASGDTAECSFTVTVNDTEPPEITCPDDIVVNNDPGECGANVTYTEPTVIDNCPNVTFSCTPASGSFFPVGTNTVACTATDAAGNTSTCTFSVTVNDTEPPEISCPDDIVVNNDPGECGAMVTYTEPTVTDNCTVVTFSCTPASGSFFPVGTNTVTCTATDAAGNTAECTFTVTVNDTEPPEITCPDDIVVNNDPGECGAIVTFPDPIVQDNCPNSTVACTPSSGSFFPVGMTTVECTATDASGNSSDSCSFEVTVHDTEPPRISCSSDLLVEVDPGEEGTVVTYPDPTVTDNCPGVTFSCSPPSGTFFPLGTTEVTCTAEDNAGNMTTCSFTVQVRVRSQNTLLLNVGLFKDVQVHSNVTLEVQANLGEPRNTLLNQQEVSDFSLQDSNGFEIIRTQLVYDWVAFYTDHQRRVFVPEHCNAQILRCEAAGDELTVRCNAIPGSGEFTVLNDDVRPIPGIPEANLVSIRFTILYRVQYYCNDIPLCDFDVPITTVDQIVLYYPEGTFIEANISDVSCTIVEEDR